MQRHISLCYFSRDSTVSKNPSPLRPSAPPFVGTSTGSTNVASCTNSLGPGSSAALQTALAVVNGNDKVKVRVLFDIGSQKTFVTPTVVERAKLQVVRKENLGIKAFGSETAERKLRDVVELDLRAARGGKRVKVEAYVVEKISEISNCHVEIVKSKYKHLADIEFSDVSDEISLQVDVLVGANFLWEFQGKQTIRGEKNEPVAVETTLGWVLSGPLNGESLLYDLNNVNVTYVEANLESKVEQFWDLDTVGVREDKDIYTEFIDDISYNGKRYSVGLPWKIGHKQLPPNFNASFTRLKSQIRKLKNTPTLLNECNKIIEEQEDLGIIEKVTELEGAEKVYYMPSQVVVRENAETTKVRMVFDASSKEGKSGTSLNDCLHVGPNLTPLLFDILVRFRENNIALVGDIEKAFLNVGVHATDRDCLRFLWVENPHENDLKLVVYRFARVVFGVNASPFLLNAVIRNHVTKFQDIDPEFVKKMLNSFFVDDLCTGAKTVQEAISLFDKSKTRMLEGGFNLRKWKSNNGEVREYVSRCEGKSKGLASANVNSNDEETYAQEKLNIVDGQGKTKVLGLVWEEETDNLEIVLDSIGTIRGERDCVTKRSVLSSLAKLFDPLGLVSPVSTIAKSFFQELCVDKIGWDEELPSEKRDKWERWEKDLKQVKSISVPRGIHPYNEETGKYSLHGFGDASAKAYCAVIYLVCETGSGIYSRLVCSKTRIAPLKGLSIPRLELMSARILANLMENVRNALSFQVEITSFKYWLDSETALFWLNNAGEWKQFVRQRVNEILAKTDKNNWGHCPGKENPADIGSRGLQASKLKNNITWWEGPAWLKQGIDYWPKRKYLERTENVDLESKKQAVVLSGAEENKPFISSVVDINRFSNMNKLLRTTARIFRFIGNVKAKVAGKEINTNEITVEEIERAEQLWIMDAQSTVSEKNDACLLRNLGVFKDNGILRCKGRLENSELDPGTILIPGNHLFANLIVLHCHGIVKHLKVRPTLAEIRTKFWIPKGRLLVRRLLSTCTVCRRLEGKPYSQPITAALPNFRVQQAEPFSKTGVDFAGPLFVREKDGSMNKVYIALFSCCVTRAVSLELVNDLSTESFLRCFRRFVARRGVPSLVISDNAKTFKAAAKLLDNLNKNPTFLTFLQNERLIWKFNLERTPWWGGFFERMVGTVKRCLRKVIGKAKLTEDELRTLILEVESIINARPLTYLYEELDSEPLTPSHLIFGRRLVTLPDNAKEININDASYSRRYKYLLKNLDHFWNRWRTEYLVNLREHNKLSGQGTAKIGVGDTVVVHEDNVKRSLWKLGRIDKFIMGRDGHIRGAKVCVISRNKPDFISRPLQKLYPIEWRQGDTNGDKESVKSSVQESERLKSEKGVVKVRRAAAQDSEWRTRLMLDSSESRRGDVLGPRPSLVS